MSLDSPALSPGWQYNLNAVTDIKATTDFWNLDETVRGCSKESEEDCSTRGLVQRVTEMCGCLPMAIWTEEYSKAVLLFLILYQRDSF